MGGQASILGDVYSFGILLLEMFTGRRPTGEFFEDGINLHDYVKKALPDQVLKIVDPLLLVQEFEADDSKTKKWQTGEGLEEILHQLFIIGLSCSTESPRERKNMKHVVNELNIIKNDFVYF